MSQTEVQLIKADAVQTADIANSAVTDAKISALTSSKLTGALPAISGASLTNLPASGKAHNLVINGAMQVAQRGTSSTSTQYQTVDRFKVFWTGHDENPTQEQADVAAGTTPYTLGFRKSLKVTNGNQTSGAGADDYLIIRTILEAQDIANSGWNYLSSSSNITLSFWVKSSVAQNFYGNVWSQDGTQYNYVFETGSLTADTWTKITKTIPGNSNLTFNNDNGEGLRLQLTPFLGTTTTGTRPLNAWAAFSSSTIQPDNTSTWWTTNDATFEITGLQLEVGSVATDFEHRSFAVEKSLCKRYYEELRPKLYILARYSHHDGAPYGQYHFNVEKRAAPTCSIDTTGGTFESSTGYSGNPSFTDTTVDSTTIYGANSVTAGGILYLHTSSSGLLKFDAEL